MWVKIEYSAIFYGDWDTNTVFFYAENNDLKEVEDPPIFTQQTLVYENSMFKVYLVR